MMLPVWDGTMTDKLEGTWNKVAMAYLRYFPIICLDGMRKTTESLSQDSWYPGQDLNQASPKYKTRVLPLGQPIQY
jgi:hypothetical protein